MRPYSHVDIHVASQVSGCGKRFCTKVAGMRFVLDVGHFMVIKIGRGGEAFATGLALVRFFSRVDSSVSVQTRAC